MEATESGDGIFRLAIVTTVSSSASLVWSTGQTTESSEYSAPQYEHFFIRVYKRADCRLTTKLNRAATPVNRECGLAHHYAGRRFRRIVDCQLNGLLPVNHGAWINMRML